MRGLNVFALTTTSQQLHILVQRQPLGVVAAVRSLHSSTPTPRRTSDEVLLTRSAAADGDDDVVVRPVVIDSDEVDDEEVVRQRFDRLLLEDDGDRRGNFFWSTTSSRTTTPTSTTALLHRYASLNVVATTSGGGSCGMKIFSRPCGAVLSMMLVASLLSWWVNAVLDGYGGDSAAGRSSDSGPLSGRLNVSPILALSAESKTGNQHSSIVSFGNIDWMQRHGACPTSSQSGSLDNCDHRDILLQEQATSSTKKQANRFYDLRSMSSETALDALSLVQQHPGDFLVAFWAQTVPLTDVTGFFESLAAADGTNDAKDNGARNFLQSLPWIFWHPTLQGGLSGEEWRQILLLWRESSAFARKLAESHAEWQARKEGGRTTTNTSSANPHSKEPILPDRPADKVVAAVAQAGVPGTENMERWERKMMNSTVSAFLEAKLLDNNVYTDMLFSSVTLPRTEFDAAAIMEIAQKEKQKSSSTSSGRSPAAGCEQGHECDGGGRRGPTFSNSIVMSPLEPKPDYVLYYMASNVGDLDATGPTWWDRFLKSEEFSERVTTQEANGGNGKNTDGFFSEQGQEDSPTLKRIRATNAVKRAELVQRATDKYLSLLYDMTKEFSPTCNTGAAVAAWVLSGGGRAAATEAASSSSSSRPLSLSSQQNSLLSAQVPTNIPIKRTSLNELRQELLGYWEEPENGNISPFDSGMELSKAWHGPADFAAFSIELATYAGDFTKNGKATEFPHFVTIGVVKQKQEGGALSQLSQGHQHQDQRHKNTTDDDLAASYFLQPFIFYSSAFLTMTLREGVHSHLPMEVKKISWAELQGLLGTVPLPWTEWESGMVEGGTNGNGRGTNGSGNGASTAGAATVSDMDPNGGGTKTANPPYSLTLEDNYARGSTTDANSIHPTTGTGRNIGERASILQRRRENLQGKHRRLDLQPIIGDSEQMFETLQRVEVANEGILHDWKRKWNELVFRNALPEKALNTPGMGIPIVRKVWRIPVQDKAAVE